MATSIGCPARPIGAVVSFSLLAPRQYSGLNVKHILVGPKPFRDSSPMVARINGVQTIISSFLNNMRLGLTRSRADYVDSNTSFLYDLVRECSGETDNSTLGRSVVEELISVYATWNCF